MDIGDKWREGIVSTLVGSSDDGDDLSTSGGGRTAEVIIAVPNSQTIFIHFTSSNHVKPQRGWMIAFEPLFKTHPNSQASLDAQRNITSTKGTVTI